MKIEPLTKKQQILLFALGINLREVQTDNKGVKFYYSHKHFNDEKELAVYEEVAKTAKISLIRVATLTNVETKYTAIYLMTISKMSMYYLNRGMADSIKKEVAKTLDLFKYGYII